MTLLLYKRTTGHRRNSRIIEREIKYPRRPRNDSDVAALDYFDWSIGVCHGWVSRSRLFYGEYRQGNIRPQSPVKVERADNSPLESGIGTIWAPVPPYVIGSLALFWAIERTVAFMP